MFKYKTSLDWIPSPTSSPCWVAGKECIHKHSDCGRCRFDCESYKIYEDLKKTKQAQDYKRKYNNMMMNDIVYRRITNVKQWKNERK